MVTKFDSRDTFDYFSQVPDFLHKEVHISILYHPVSVHTAERVEIISPRNKLKFQELNTPHSCRTTWFKKSSVGKEFVKTATSAKAIVSLFMSR